MVNAREVPEKCKAIFIHSKASYYKAVRIVNNGLTDGPSDRHNQNVFTEEIISSKTLLHLNL